MLLSVSCKLVDDLQALYAIQALHVEEGTGPHSSRECLKQIAAFPLSCELSCLAIIPGPAGEIQAPPTP